MESRAGGWRQAINEFLFGVFSHEDARELTRQWAWRDNLFLLLVFGDIVGLPILPPYYAMRLLPFAMPSFDFWKRRVLREKDWAAHLE